MQQTFAILVEICLGIS